MTDIFNRQRSALQFENLMKQKKQLADSGYARSAKPLKRQAQPDQDSKEDIHQEDNKTPGVSNAIIIRLADIRTVQGKLSTSGMNRSVGNSVTSKLAAGIETDGEQESTAARKRLAAAVPEEVLVASVETMQGIVEFILIGSEMHARVPGLVVERLVFGDSDIELAPISPGLYALRGLSHRAFMQSLRKVTDA